MGTNFKRSWLDADGSTWTCGWVQMVRGLSLLANRSCGKEVKRQEYSPLPAVEKMGN